MKKIILLGILLALFGISCATTPISPPTGAVSAEAPTLIVGSKFLFRETDLINKKTETYIWTVQEIRTYEKKPAYWISIAKGQGIDSAGEEEGFLVYDLELNGLARFKDGEEIRSASPCIRTFSWPLFVGKKWIASYDFFDKERGPFRDMRDFVRVESYEEVKVPAGIFQAFKIKRVGAGNTFIDYYAPSIKMTVKTIRDQASIGKKSMSELMAFHIPLK